MHSHTSLHSFPMWAPSRLRCGRCQSVVKYPGRPPAHFCSCQGGDMAVSMPFFSPCTQGPELRAQFPRQQGCEEEFHLLEAEPAVNKIMARPPRSSTLPSPREQVTSRSAAGPRGHMLWGDRWGNPEPGECGGGSQRLLLESHSSPATFRPQTERMAPFCKASPMVEAGQPR